MRAAQNGIISFELFLGKNYPPNPLIISCLIITDSSPKYILREKLSGFGAGEMQGDWGGVRWPQGGA